MKTPFYRIATVCLLLLLCATCALAATTYTTLQRGDSGTAVLRLKQAMYWLGYFKTLDLTDEYNATMVERVQQLQEKNGLTVDGIASPELQTLVFSGNCVPSGTQPKASPAPTPTPAPIAPKATPAMPALTEEGFLTEDAGQEEYIYEDATDGLWIYKSSSLSVEIRRMEDKTSKIVWFETEVYCSPETPLSTYLTQGKTPGTRFTTPMALAQENQVVLAITDDFFGTRVNNNARPGIIVRNGALLYDRTHKANHGALPCLEVLAVFDDGSMKTYLSDALTGAEYLAMGATNVFSFGPVLVTEGEIGPHMLEKDYYYYREPRCAIGMIEPYHYILLTVKGRVDESRGVYMPWLAEKMLEKGVVEALNLDGGGTIALVFMGKLLSSGGNNVRNVGSIIGFGNSNAVK